MKRMSFCLALSLCAAATALAGTPPTFTVGTLKVTRSGHRGRPLIFIPGLTCGAWAWQDTIDHLQKDHVIYAVTLAGFDGTQAPAEGDLLDAADASLLELIQTRHIDKPVLIGHSIGGTLSIRFAEEHASLISGVIAVDGLPVFPGTDKLDAKKRKGMAGRMQAMMAASSRDQFRAQQEQYMAHMGVLDAKLAHELAARSSTSDPVAVARYMAEDLALDLRPGLARVTVPLLEISPYNAPDFAPMPGYTEAKKTAYYQQILTGAPHVEVLSISPARHFVMYDQPERTRQAIARFLAALR